MALNQPIPNPITNNTPLYAGQILLFALQAANFQLTTDQPFAKQFSGTNYQVTSVVARPRSGAASVACAGGIYDAVGKSGNIIVLAAASWVALSFTASPPVSVNPAVNLLASVLANLPILSLTTGSTAAITADVFIYGYDLT
jgi:hypothetical protein